MTQPDERAVEAVAKVQRFDTTCPADKRQCDKVPCPHRVACTRNDMNRGAAA